VYARSGSNSESGETNINRVYLEGENEQFIDMFMGMKSIIHVRKLIKRMN